MNPKVNRLYHRATQLLDVAGYDDTTGYVLALSLDNVGDVAYDEQPSCFIGTIESCCCDMDMTDAQRDTLRAIAEQIYKEQA